MALMLGLTLAVGITVGVIGDQILSAQQEAVKSTELIRKDLGEMKGKEGVLFRTELAPGGAGPKHFHPGNEFVYVVKGSGILEAQGKPPLPVKAGDTFYQPPKQVHVFKNASATDPAEVVVFLIVDKGKPIIVPVK